MLFCRLKKGLSTPKFRTFCFVIIIDKPFFLTFYMFRSCFRTLAVILGSDLFSVQPNNSSTLILILTLVLSVGLASPACQSGLICLVSLSSKIRSLSLHYSHGAAISTEKNRRMAGGDRVRGNQLFILAAAFHTF